MSMKRLLGATGEIMAFTDLTPTQLEAEFQAPIPERTVFMLGGRKCIVYDRVHVVALKEDGSVISFKRVAFDVDIANLVRVKNELFALRGLFETINDGISQADPRGAEFGGFEPESLAMGGVDEAHGSDIRRSVEEIQGVVRTLCLQSSEISLAERLTRAEEQRDIAQAEADKVSDLSKEVARLTQAHNAAQAEADKVSDLKNEVTRLTQALNAAQAEARNAAQADADKVSDLINEVTRLTQERDTADLKCTKIPVLEQKISEQTVELETAKERIADLEKTGPSSATIKELKESRKENTTLRAEIASFQSSDPGFAYMLMNPKSGETLTRVHDGESVVILSLKMETKGPNDKRPVTVTATEARQALSLSRKRKP